MSNLNNYRFGDNFAIKFEGCNERKMSSLQPSGIKIFWKDNILSNLRPVCVVWESRTWILQHKDYRNIFAR